MTGKVVLSKDITAVFDYAPWYTGSCQSPNTALPPTTTPLIEIIKQYDPIFRGWATHRYSIFGCLQAFPLTPDLKRDSFYLSSEPDLSEPNPGYDRVCYGSTLHNLPTLVDVLVSGAAPVAPGDSSERFCRHSTFSGSAVYPADAVSLLPPTSKGTVQLISFVQSPVAYNTDYRSYSGPFSWGLKHRTTNQFYWSYITQPDYRCAISFADLISHLQDGFDFGYGTAFYHTDTTISSFINTDELFHFVVHSSTSLAGPYYPYDDAYFTWSYAYTFLPKKALASMYFDPTETTYWKLRFRDADYFTFLSATCSIPSRSTTLPVLSQSDVLREVIINTPYTSAAPNCSVDGFYSFRPTCWSVLRSFRKAVDSSWIDILPSSLHSTVAAVQDIESGTSTDILQSLAKLPQVESMVPKIKEGIDILSHIVRKDLSLSTIRDIVDLASSTTLQASFQWRPILQLLSTELPKVVDALSPFLSGKRLVVGRGSFDFNFQSSTFNRVSTHLTTRSKIVLDVSARALAASLLGFDSFGVLPKPSNLWDLVPWSFALNWFTGVGKSMSRMEYAILLATIPAYYVHTYTVTSPFTNEELTSWSSGSSSSDPLSMKLFYRDVSHFSPAPKTSRFGFDLPANLPPLGTVAALLWQVLT